MKPEVPEVLPDPSVGSLISAEEEILAAAPEEEEEEGKPAADLRVEQLQQLQTQAFLDVAQGIRTLVENQQATRQVPYNEMKPVTPWNPEGKRDRVKLPHAVFMHGRPLNTMMMSEQEIALAGQLKPGRYIERKVEVQRSADGSVNITYPHAKVPERMEFARRFPDFSALALAIIAERKLKEERRRSGAVDPDEAL